MSNVQLTLGKSFVLKLNTMVDDIISSRGAGETPVQKGLVAPCTSASKGPDMTDDKVLFQSKYLFYRSENNFKPPSPKRVLGPLRRSFQCFRRAPSSSLYGDPTSPGKRHYVKYLEAGLKPCEGYLKCRARTRRHGEGTYGGNKHRCVCASCRDRTQAGALEVYCGIN